MLKPMAMPAPKPGNVPAGIQHAFHEPGIGALEHSAAIERQQHGDQVVDGDDHRPPGRSQSQLAKAADGRHAFAGMNRTLAPGVETLFLTPSDRYLFLSATIALTQNDIKRVLAYSTCSQLGFMIMGLGVGGYTAGLAHLTTHAAFKACLFLGSGSVIHAVHSQDIFEMGGLWKKMKITAATFIIATLAIAGVPGFSGFYSKDMILAAALEFGMWQPEHLIIFFGALGGIGWLLQTPDF